ncbi:MAG: hypothetical protein R3B54_03770 [Bdellovibrionota bacterium]
MTKQLLIITLLFQVTAHGAQAEEPAPQSPEAAQAAALKQIEESCYAQYQEPACAVLQELVAPSGNVAIIEQVNYARLRAVRVACETDASYPGFRDPCGRYEAVTGEKVAREFPQIALEIEFSP